MAAANRRQRQDDMRGNTVTVSMLWVGILIIGSQGWIAAVRDRIQSLSGVK